MSPMMLRKHTLELFEEPLLGEQDVDAKVRALLEAVSSLGPSLN
jgi:hypothetical protein